MDQMQPNGACWTLFPCSHRSTACELVGWGAVRWLLQWYVCALQLWQVQQTRGENKQALSPFFNLHPIKGNEKSMSAHQIGLQVANELIFKTCHLSCLSLSLQFSLFFFLSLAALQDRAPAGLQGCQYCSVSAKCQPGTCTHTLDPGYISPVPISIKWKDTFKMYNLNLTLVIQVYNRVCCITGMNYFTCVCNCAQQLFNLLWPQFGVKRYNSCPH